MESEESTNFLRVCSACGATVERNLCHKNRYGEYICRKCQHDGVEFTWRQRLRYSKKWLIPAFFLSLAIAGLVLWTFYRASKSY